MRTIHALVAVTLLAAVAPAADWTQFRGPDGLGVSAETGLPVQWSATEGLRWKAALPGRGLSAPVIAGGRVYVTACTGPLQERLHVLCLSLADGKQLWERQFWATGNTLCHPKTSMAAPTPCTDGEHVYALFATGDIVCLDREGNLAWYRSLVGDYPTITNQVGMAASPLLWKDVLVVPMENAGDSFVAGLDRHTGQNRWKVPRPRDINWTTPIVMAAHGQAELLFQSGKELVSLDPENGRKRWAHAAQLSTIPSPLPGKGVVLVPGGDGLTALRSRSGDKPEVVWKSGKLRSAGYATPLYYDGRVYALTGVGLNCADANDGKEIWQQRAKGPFAASLVAGDGKVYAVAEDGTTYVVQTGAQPTLLASNTVGETVLATPAIADGALFLRSDGHLYCIGAKK